MGHYYLLTKRKEGQKIPYQSNLTVTQLSPEEVLEKYGAPGEAASKYDGMYITKVAGKEIFEV